MNTARHTTRLVALLAFSLLATSAFAQTTLEWRSDAANGNWNDAGNWSDGTQPPPGSEILIFDNNVQTSMTNDAANTLRHRILFQGGASSTRTIGGSTANLFVAVGGDAPMIQNNSAGSHHLNFPIEVGADGLIFDTLSGPLNIGGLLSGAGTITKTGGAAGGIQGQPQNIAVSADNSGFTGKWVVTGGNLSINDDAALGAVPASFVADAITLDGGSLANMTSASGGGFGLGHSYTLHANRGITLGPGGGNIRLGYTTRTVTIEGAITGLGALSLSDNAILVLANSNNTYEGGTVVRGTTTLRIVDDGSLGKVPESFSANNVVLQGGVTLANYGSADVVIDPNRGIAISGGARLRSSGSNRSLTVGSVISGSGGLTILSDSGTVVLTGANTYSGGTTIQAGARLSIGDGGGTGSVVGDITNDGTLTVNRSTDWTYSGAIAGAGTLTKMGGGALQLSGASSYTGSTTVTGGSLRIAGDNSLGTAPDTFVANHLVLNGGQLMNLDSDPVIAATRGIELGAAGGNLRAGWSKSLTVESAISGAGGLTIVSNSGTVILSGENTYGGATSVQSALKLEGGDNRLPVGTQLALSNASLAVLDLNGTNQTVRWLTGGGASGGSVVNTGGTTSTLTLNLGASGNRTFDGTIDGDIRVVVANSTTKNTDVQIFTRTNSYTSGTVVDNGHLRIREDTYLGTVPASLDPQNIVLRKGGVLQNHEVNLQLNANRGIFLEEGDGVFYTGWDGDLTVNGPLSGPGRLVKADNGRLLLGAAGDHTGDTVLRHHSSGPRAIVLLHGDALQQSTFDATTIGGTSGTLDLNNLDVVLGGLKGAGASITNFTGQLSIGNNHQDTVFSGSLGGSGSLVKIGDGSLTLAGDNPYTGGTSICDGVLQIGAGGTTGSLGSGNVTNDGVLVFNRSNNITVANAITGTGSVRKEGQNELILSGSNDYSGGTTVTGGLLRATDNTIGTGGLTLQDGGVFFNVASEAGGVDPDNDFQNAVTLAAGGGGFRAGWGAMTLSGQIDGVGSLTIVNDGRITLTNTANAYEGDTIIGAAGSGTSATLRLGASEVIPHGPGKGNVVFNPIAGDTATLELNGHTETVNALVSSAEGTSRVTGPGTLIVGANDASGAFAGILTGAMSLVKIGNGTQVLSGDSNNYTGATTIDGGTLQLHGGDNRLPVGTSVAFADAAGATLDLNGTNQTVRWLTGGGPSGGHVVNTGGATSTLTLNLGNPGNRTFDGTIDGDIRVVVANSTTKNTDVQIFTRTNSYTSGTVVDNGHLRVREDSYLGTVPASLDPQNIVLRKGGVLQNHEVNLQLNANRGIFLEEGDGVFYTGWDRDLTVNGPLFGPGRLVKADNGRLLLAAAGSHTGDTVFQYYATGPRAIVLLHENALQQSTFDATVLGGAGDFVLDLNHLNVVLGGLKGGGASITNFTGQLSVGNNHQDTVFSGSLSGSGSLVKIGEGMLTLAGANLYTGATRIDIGTLRVDGSLTGTSGVTVESAAVLGGRGRIHAAVGGAGLVAPGASPGILTVGQVDPSGGLDFAFEFTGTGNPLWSEPAASVNDVLRMTDLQTPFTAPLTAENVVSVYFDVADVAAGDTFRGGFFTDASDDFLGSLEDAAYHYFVYGDGQGTAATYNDKSYYSLADWDSWVWVELSTPMVALANFAGGDVLHGRVSQFAVVPEPGTFLMAGAGLAILLGWRRRRQ